ncbi:MAG: asparagine synthase (glutamine-hydrolyzing) [Woeseiaceae bacterium]
MCGIVGVAFSEASRGCTAGLAKNAGLAALAHRGPDARGQFADDVFWCGHARLSILDLTSAGDQPMTSSDGRFVICYNGEVYNFRELAKQFGLDGLKSGTDTEVVLRLFRKLGVDSFVHLNGMFAFALYDRSERKLWLVRDRLGIKPLYYTLTEDKLCFSSEVKGIFRLDSMDAYCDPEGLHEWLYFGNPLGEKTLFSGVNQLLPSHYLEIDLATFSASRHQYWSVERQVARAAPSRGRHQDLVEETRRHLEEAVRRQLVSDVPIGVFLSGGIDSSAIVAFASRHYENRLTTYSIGFDFLPGNNELPVAKRTATRFGTDHHEVHVSGFEVSDLIDRMVENHDMPFSDAANIPLYLMAAKISGTTKVVLQGDGGDELFGGYRRYSTMSWMGLLHPLARIAHPFVRAASRSATGRRVERYTNALSQRDLASTMALLLTMENPVHRPSAVFNETIRRQVERFDPFARYRKCQASFSDCDRANQMSFVDLKIVLPDTFLEKVDRATMASGVEVRVPFLDHDLVEFALGIAGTSKVPYGRKKWLLKRALQGVIPAEVLHGPKSGLQVPYSKWLQGPLKSKFFDSLDTFCKTNPDVLDSAHVTKLYDQMWRGEANHSLMLWKILNLVVWAHKYDVKFAA